METIVTVEQLFGRYDAIAGVVGQMRSAARADDWDRVIELQQQYSALVDTLRPVDASFELTEPQRARKQELTRQILADESAVRELASPRLARLSAQLTSTRQTRALHQMYGLSARG